MAKARGDHQTLDLLDWQPPEIVHRYDDASVRSPSLRVRISRAIATTLATCGKSRTVVAAEMSIWLNEDVSENMLNNYASQAKEEHAISFHRLLALVHVTGDVRALQLGAEFFDHTIIHNRHLDWVEVGMKADRREDARRLQEEIDKDYEASLQIARRRAER